MNDKSLLRTVLDGALGVGNERVHITFPVGDHRRTPSLSTMLYLRGDGLEFLQAFVNAWLEGPPSDDYLALYEIFGKTMGAPGTHVLRLATESDDSYRAFRMNIHEGKYAPGTTLIVAKASPALMKNFLSIVPSGWNGKGTDPWNSVYEPRLE